MIGKWSEISLPTISIFSQAEVKINKVFYPTKYGCYFSLVFILGCSSLNIQTQDCDPTTESKVRKDLADATYDIQQCLKKYNRTEDLDAYNLLLRKKLNVTCDQSKNSDNLAIAETKKDSPTYPGMKIYTDNRDDSSISLKKTLAHESLHWLGYEHYVGYDLSYIAEMCCMDHGGEFLNEIGRESCRLFEYKNEQWLDANYIKDLTYYLAFFGRSFIGFKTAIEAAIQAQKLKYPKEAIFRILEKTSLEICRSSYDEKITPRDYKYYSNSTEVTQALVMSYVVNNSDSAYAKILRERFFKNDKGKINFLAQFAQTLKNLIFQEHSKLTKSWVSFKKMEKSTCKVLSKNEIDALKELATNTHVALFDEKKNIVDFKEKKLDMLIQWTKICDNNK